MENKLPKANYKVTWVIQYFVSNWYVFKGLRGDNNEVKEVTTSQASATKDWLTQQ